MIPWNGEATSEAVGSQPVEPDMSPDATTGQDQLEKTDFQDVEVDQCALVNILARYPGEFDVLRELIQNADDAEAKSIEVHFQTGGSEKFQPAGGLDISQVKVRKWVIINKGGNTFTDDDWGRLRKIADGNKNTAKVGAFGVGFYSVLSKTDKPLVKSSNKLLRFARGENGKLQHQFQDCPTPERETSIELELRELQLLPKLDNLARFLVSSVTFLTNIETAEVYLDDFRLLHVQKKSPNPVQIPIPEHLTGRPLAKALAVLSVERTVQTITIDPAECTFPSEQLTSSSAADTAEILVERRARAGEAHITHASQNVDAILGGEAIVHDLYIATINVDLKSEPEMIMGVKSSVKSLPSSFKCKAVYFNHEQLRSLDVLKNSPSHKAKNLACLFSGPHGIAPGDESGRLFIGQSTHQTTGIALHISAHFLPTMERSSVDLTNGQIAAWNHEVLKVGGLLARVVYEQEMHIAAKLPKNDVAMKQGLSTMARFAFGSTTPHAGVSRILRDAFYSCCHESKPPLPVVSAVGIVCASDKQFRQSNKDLSFLTRYRVLHEEIKGHQCSQIITKYDIPRFRYGDIVKEFEIGATREALKLFFGWWEDTRKNALTTDETRYAATKFCSEFASRAILHTNHDSRLELKNIKYYTFFPLPDDLLPPDTIYIDVSSGLPTKVAIEAFGWSQLPLLGWLEYAHIQARQHSLDGASGPDSDMGYRISRALVQFALVEDLSAEQWNRVAAFMKDLKCIPTNKGLKTPGESYFEEADVCKSLPVVLESEFLTIPVTQVANRLQFEYRSVNAEHVRKVLIFIRVHVAMDWKHTIAELEDNASQETNNRLLQFLVLRLSVLQSLLPVNWRNDLKEKKILRSKDHGRLFATELYLPHEDILNLNLPILALPRDCLISLQSIVDPSSSFQIELFIEDVGVRRYPPLEKVISLAASDNPGVQKSALQYLLSNFDKHYSAYKPEDFANYAFIPTQAGSLARLNDVMKHDWRELGFELVSEDLGRNYLRLGVRDDPSADTIIERLKDPENTLPDLKTATIWFEHLCNHGNFPIAKLRDQLSKISFVPVQDPSTSSSGPSVIKHISPKDCFIGSTEAKKHHRDIFPFVDFGQNGNDFLDRCGAKKSPDASDIARRICQSPEEYLKALHGDYDLYVEDLRTIASSFDSISNNDKETMKKASMFLALRKGEKRLLLPEQVVINDWESRDFGGLVFEAPTDNILEKMYVEMGSQFWGKYVRYDIHSIDHQASHTLPFNGTWAIRRIKCLMDKQDDSMKTGVSFYNHDKASHLEVKLCKKLTLKKTFVPSLGMLVDEEVVKIVETKVKAGLEFNETDNSYTLWMAKDAINTVDLRNHTAVGLCHVLLKTYGPNEVFLLASLFAMDDTNLDTFYGPDTKLELADPPPKEKPKNRVTVELMLPFVGRMFGGLKTITRIRMKAKQDPPDNDVITAIGKCPLAATDQDGHCPDFSGPIQSRPGSVKYASHCKEASKISLKEQGGVEVEGARFRFFLADGVQLQHREPALRDFAQLIRGLADVYSLSASTACYIFWKDTDQDLMAFNRDQQYIFFNLAYHEREFYNKKEVDMKKVLTEWFLIMAHELAHNITLDHDEYHGALTSRIAVAYFPKLREKFPAHFSDDAA